MSSEKNRFNLKDRLYMGLALSLAQSREGLTGINPSVGCVIVKDDEILSIGQTGFGGYPHAEYNAINNSCTDLEGSKMYITLEPCNHYGKTPPCTKEIIKNRISEVFYSIEDIDKKVKGKSYKILKNKNIIVEKGLLAKNIKAFYFPYFYNRKNKLPYVTGKIAVSKNNLIYSKGKKKITDIHSDQLTHFLRYKNDSLLVSYKTITKDNPKLNCRLKNLIKFSPKRIILDNNLEMKTNSYIFKSSNKKNTLIFYNNAKKSKIKMFKNKGIKLIKSDLIKKKYFNIRLILKKLYNFGNRNLLIEGGNDLTKSFLKKRLFNQFYLFKSPKNLSKLVEYKSFNCFKELSQNYINKSKVKINLGQDLITLFRK